MKIGVNDIVDCKIGTNQVAKVYLGSNLVWEKASSTLLLDVYPNASAAYSLRKLRTAYAGDAIEVRIDTATTPQPFYNIGFDSNGNLDTADLLSKAGSNDAYVAAWYDQSLNGLDATQSNAARQPQIVISGSFVSENGKPAIRFNTPTTLNTGVNLGISTIKSYYSVNMADQLIGYRTLFCNSYNKSDSILVGLYNNTMDYNNWIQGENNLTHSITTSLDTQNLVNGSYETGTNGIKRYINSALDTQYTTSKSLSATPSTIFSIGGSASDNNYYWRGVQQELIFYPTAGTSNRVGIETNINNHYTIY